jgi:hypothetical protein
MMSATWLCTSARRMHTVPAPPRQRDAPHKQRETRVPPPRLACEDMRLMSPMHTPLPESAIAHCAPPCQR